MHVVHLTDRRLALSVRRNRLDCYKEVDCKVAITVNAKDLCLIKAIISHQDLPGSILRILLGRTGVSFYIFMNPQSLKGKEMNGLLPSAMMMHVFSPAFVLVYHFQHGLYLVSC